MVQPYAVGIILDPLAGDGIRAIARRLDVWIVPSPANTATVQQLQNEQAGSRSGNLTLWSNTVALRTEEEWNGAIEVIEMHHGEFSHNPPVSIIEVFGGILTTQSERAFRNYGYSELEITSNGFRASKPENWAAGIP